MLEFPGIRTSFSPVRRCLGGDRGSRNADLGGSDQRFDSIAAAAAEIHAVGVLNDGLHGKELIH